MGKIDGHPHALVTVMQCAASTKEIGFGSALHKMDRERVPPLGQIPERGILQRIGGMGSGRAAEPEL